MKTLIKSVLSLMLVMICGYVVAAGGGAFWRGSVRDVADGPPVVEIGLVSGPIHYDFLIPLNDKTRAMFEFAPLPIAHPDARWLVAGWGARGFYTTVGGYTDVSPRALFDGVFGDTSVVRLDVVGDIPASIIDETLMLGDAQFDAFLSAIRGAISDPAAPLPIAGFGEHDVFYASTGRFNILRTCNVWIGEVLREAGVDFGAWTPIPLSVTASLRHFHPS